MRTTVQADRVAAQAAWQRDVPAAFDSGASWIWDAGAPNPRNAWRVFRRTFRVDDAVADGELLITADTRYEAYVNGELVGRGPVRGFAHRWMVDRWDIGPSLNPGADNVVAVLVVHHGVSTFVDVGNRAGVLAQVSLADGTVVATDASWKVTTPAGYNPRSNRTSCQLGFAEQVDGRSMPVGWTECTFDDGAWDAATAISGDAWPNLVMRDIPPLAERLVRPTHVERLAFVRPFAITATIDMRNHLSPESVHHANHVGYAGYLVTVLRVHEATTVTVAMPWSRFRGMGLNGDWHTYDDLPVGMGGQRAITRDLEPGDHWLVIDVSRVDHGDGFQVAVDAGIPNAVSLVSPLGDDAETPFVTLNDFPGTTANAAPMSPEVPTIPAGIAAAAQSLASRSAFDAFAGAMHSVPAALVSDVDLFTLATQPREREERPIPAAMQAVVSGNGASIPVQAGRDTEVIFDLGREFSGYTEFTISAPAGVIVDVYGFEYLRGSHRENTWRLDNSFRYITRAGWQRYASPNRRGMRFLQLTFRNLTPGDAVILHDLAVTESHFPVSGVGRFRSSDTRLDAIWEMSRRTVLACMEDTYVDCPAFEQTYWVGDAYNSARFARTVFGAEALTERCIRLVPGSVGQTPYFASQVPSGWVSVIPNWTFLWVMTARDHWFRTGDDAFAAELWPAVGAALDAFREHINGDGLLDIEAWNLLDWAPMDQPNAGVVTHQNCIMVLALDAAADLARAGGDAAGAERMAEAATDLRDAINAHLWSDQLDGYIDCIHADGRRSETCSVQVHMFALLAGIPQGERAKRAQQVLVDPPAGWVEIGSPWMSAFLYDALADLGRTADAVADIRLNYGMMLDHGATTCWEVYPVSPVATSGHTLTRSHCHAWSAAPAAFLPERLLGVKPLVPGWRSVSVVPDPCGLEWADGSIPLPGEGRIDVSWRMAPEGRMRLEVSAPVDVELSAALPDGIEGTVVINGTTVA